MRLKTPLHCSSMQYYVSHNLALFVINDSLRVTKVYHFILKVHNALVILILQRICLTILSCSINKF